MLSDAAQAAAGGRGAGLPFMPRIKLDSVVEGMTVAADVKNMDDMLLIPAGCVLTARHINILRTWGISEIQTEGEEQEATTLITIAPEILARLEAELQKLFWQYDPGSSVQREIFQLALRRRARAFLNQGSHVV
jgi:hypothetical protein